MLHWYFRVGHPSIELSVNSTPLTTTLQTTMLTAVPEQPLNLERTVIKTRWKIVKLIGKGAFGHVYSATDAHTNTTVAIKIETPLAKRQLLKLEIALLKRIESPLYIAGGRFILPHTDAIYTYLVMTLLDQNLSELRKKIGALSQHSTGYLAVAMIREIEQIHKQGILHRDIKPANFCMLGASVVMIDYGLARRFKTGDGIRPARGNCGFRGTARYASIHAHLGQELARRDDMWSLLYVLIEFLTGTLPWKGKEKEAIRDLKIDAHKSKWIEQYPQPIVSFYRHVDTLGYESPPDYDYLVGLFAEWTAQPAQLDWESTQSDNTEPLVALAADPESMADGDDLSAEMQLDDHRVPITSPVHKPKFRNANLDRQIASAPLGGHSGALDCENRTLNRKSCIDIMIVEDTKKYILSFQ